MLPSIAAHEDSFTSRLEVATEAKAALARRRRGRRRRGGESVFLDSSTTAYHVARELLDRGVRATVITNSLPIMDLVAAHPRTTIDLVGVGGMLRRLTRSFVGPFAVRRSSSATSPTASSSASRASPPDGALTDPDALEAEVKRAMIAHAEHPILLLDESKLSTHGRSVLGRLTDVVDRARARRRRRAPGASCAPPARGSRSRVAGGGMNAAGERRSSRSRTPPSPTAPSTPCATARSRCAPARCARSSARTAPASRRWSSCSAASCASTTGEMLVDGEPVDFHSPTDARDAGIAVIYQEPTLFPDLSVAENVVMGRHPIGALRRIERGAMHREVQELLDRLGVRLDAERPVRGLSIADQQIVEIAKALSFDARVLIMDEPTAALSGPEVERLFGVVRTLRDRGAGVLFISHRLEEVFALCETVTVMRDGAVVHDARDRRR